MKQPQKLYNYLVKKALYEGKDTKEIIVPGVNASIDANGGKPVYPGGLPSVSMVQGASPLSKVPDDVEPEMTDEEVLDRISSRFNSLHKLARGVCEGAVRSLIVSGAGGVGKSHTIERIVEHYKEKQNLHATIVKGGVISPVSLYILLYKNRYKGAVTVIDDGDSVFEDVDALTLMKGALDTSPVRRLSWLTNSPLLKAEGIENEFLFEGQVIFISNINFQREIERGKNKNTVHLQAFMTRAMYLDLKLHTRRELVLWIQHMILKNHILQQEDLTSEQEKEVLAYLLAHKTNLRNLSIRTALQVAQCMKLDPENWKKLADDTALVD
jgi:hypothetical protein